MTELGRYWPMNTAATASVGLRTIRTRMVFSPTRKVSFVTPWRISTKLSGKSSRSLTRLDCIIWIGCFSWAGGQGEADVVRYEHGRVAAINIVVLLFHVGIHAASDELPKAAAQFFQLYAANVYPTPPALQSDNLVPRTCGHLATVPWLRFA